MGKIDPTPGTLRFGVILGDAMEVAGFNNSALARKIPISNTWVGQVLKGTTRCTLERATRIDEVLEADGRILEEWEKYVKDSDRPRPFVDYEVREPDADVIQMYETMYISGLLQTPAYAAAQLNSERDLAKRLARQKVLDRESPPTLCMILDESVLYRQVGTREVMREQLEYLLEICERFNITIQIARYNADTRTSSSFNLATLPDTTMVAFIDTLLDGETVHATKRLTHLSAVFTRLQGQALNAEDTRAYIRKVIEEVWS
ncbi:DUF5753 domain-containing protein [Actinomadura flavalba]|uniref:DUF5753 domain-containing protein n=1 Tax=Actinomadura flavalba TaxID=1120938 RepID=UPI000364848F|nr:DUF5753 domain-containing protein [Actinomadura flavalba]